MKEKKDYIDSITGYINSSGKSQKEIADKLGVSQATISGIVNGERDPKLSTVVGLANLFKVSIDTLVNYTPENTALSQSENRLRDRLTYLQQTIHGTVASFKDWTPKDVADYVWQELYTALNYEELCKEADEVLVVDSWGPDNVTGHIERRPGYRYGVPVSDTNPEDR